MVARKRRIAVVLDTNVLVRALKSRSRSSPNQRILRLWLLQKRLQLIVSAAVVSEYLGVFRDVLLFDDELIEEWRRRFQEHDRATLVNLGRRYRESCDPDDNVFLDTAAAGAAKFLVTNDRDLLDIPPERSRTFRFRILAPAAFLESLERRE